MCLYYFVLFCSSHFFFFGARVSLKRFNELVEPPQGHRRRAHRVYCVHTSAHRSAGKKITKKNTHTHRAKPLGAEVMGGGCRKGRRMRIIGATQERTRSSGFGSAEHLLLARSRERSEPFFFFDRGVEEMMSLKKLIKKNGEPNMILGWWF